MLEDMASPPNHVLTPQTATTQFGAGLTEAEAHRFQTILSQACGRDVSLSETWSRATEILSLVEILLEVSGQEESTGSSRSVALD